MCRRIGQRIDDLQLLDDRSGPSVGNEERQRILVIRTNVNEMDVEAIDLGDEVRQGLQLLLALAPVVLFRPVAREGLHRREPRALRVILDGLPLGEARRGDTRPQVLEVRFGGLDRERADRGVGRWSFDYNSHGSLLCWGRWISELRAGRIRIAVILELVPEEIEHAASRRWHDRVSENPRARSPHRWRVAASTVCATRPGCSADLT